MNSLALEFPDKSSESVACQLEQLLPEAGNIPKQYYRFQADLTEASDNIDDTSPENLKQLKELAQKIIDKKKQTKQPKIKDWDSDWKEMCGQLTESL